jgi:ZIP family zinc transporter
MTFLMNELTITMLGLFFGMLGTTLGGIVGACFDINSQKIISFILEIAAGLMTAVICFDLIPESLKFISLSRFNIGNHSWGYYYDFMQ